MKNSYVESSNNKKERKKRKKIINEETTENLSTCVTLVWKRNATFPSSALLFDPMLPHPPPPHPQNFF